MIEIKELSNNPLIIPTTFSIKCRTLGRLDSNGITNQVLTGRYLEINVKSQLSEDKVVSVVKECVDKVLLREYQEYLAWRDSQIDIFKYNGKTYVRENFNSQPIELEIPFSPMYAAPAQVISVRNNYVNHFSEYNLRISVFHVDLGIPVRDNSEYYVGFENSELDCLDGFDDFNYFDCENVDWDDSDCSDDSE
jgi:hypothetical protein